MIRSHLPRHLPKPKRGCKGKLGSVNVFLHVTNGDAPSNVNACCINSCTLSNRFTCLQDRQNVFACSSETVVDCTLSALLDWRFGLHSSFLCPIQDTLWESCRRASHISAGISQKSSKACYIMLAVACLVSMCEISEMWRLHPTYMTSAAKLSKTKWRCRLQ